MRKGSDLALEEGLLSSNIEKLSINLKHLENTGLLNWGGSTKGILEVERDGYEVR